MRILQRIIAAYRAFWWVLWHGPQKPTLAAPDAARFSVVSDEGVWHGNDIREASRRIERARASNMRWSYHVDGVERRNG